jgi:hypothetical protein
VENPTTTGTTTGATTGAATGVGPPSRVPVSYEVASLSTLFEALATLDQDYVLTVDHENDIASAFRNLVIKMAQTQVANSESKYAVFLVREICIYCTCWLYSLCNFQYRQQYENTCSYNFEC